MTTPMAELSTIDVPREVAPGAGVVSVEALRYLIASVAALSLDAGLLWVGAREFGIAPWLAGAGSYLAGLVLIYVLSVRWVFARRALVNQRKEFVVFAALGATGLLINSTVLFGATTLGCGLPLAKALAAGLGFVANFVSRKVLLF
jgi:putative flippase GtrA